MLVTCSGLIALSRRRPSIAKAKVDRGALETVAGTVAGAAVAGRGWGPKGEQAQGCGAIRRVNMGRLEGGRTVLRKHPGGRSQLGSW